MKAKWTARLVLQLICGLCIAYLAGKLLPDRTKPENFKVGGAVLVGTAAALVIADLFFNATVKKLDEPLNMPSFTVQQRKALRNELRRLEVNATVIFYISTVCKAVFGAVGGLFVGQLIPDILLCTRLFFGGFFLLGFALPTIILLPRAYFAAKDARSELIDLEEKAALKQKMLESLQSEPEHDFAADPHFVAFSNVLKSGK